MYDEELRKSRCDNKVFFDKIELPYNMEKLDKNIEGWLEDETKTDSDFGGKNFYFKKVLSNEWDLIIDWSINSGNNHFAITINFPTHEDKWGITYNYDEFSFEDYIMYLEDVIGTLKFHFNTISYIFVVVEKHKKGTPHLHLLVAIKNFIDYDYCLKNNIANVLKFYLGAEISFKNSCDYDVKVQSLRRFRDIKN